MVKRLIPERADHLVRLHVAEPSPLGLFGLAGGCLLLLCTDFSLTEGSLLTIPWLFYLPGLLQFIAGIFDFLRHNIFGATAFTGYSIFWFGLATSDVLIEYIGEDNKELMPHPTAQHTAVMTICYLIFTGVLILLSMGINKTLFIDLCFVFGAYFFLMLHIFDGITNILLGICLIAVFLISIYGFTAILLLKTAGGEVLPLGKPIINWEDYILDDAYQSHSHINNQKSKNNKNTNKKIDKNDNFADVPAHSPKHAKHEKHAANNSIIKKTAGGTGKDRSNSYLRIRNQEQDNEQLELVAQ